MLQLTKPKAVAIGAAAAWTAGKIWRRTRRMSLAGKTVVITGGSRGLGLELARVFGEAGANLALLARDRDELERARDALGNEVSARVEIVRCDVSERDTVKEAVDSIADRLGRIDVLVNNAGVIQVGPLANMTRADFEQAMNVHTWGALNMVEAVLPHMVRQPKARIVNISSIGGKVSVPHLLPYCTSKFALTGLSDGLRAELASSNISVTTVIPGLMRTGSHVNAQFKGQHKKEYGWFAVTAGFPLASVSSDHAARTIVDACVHGDPVLILSPQARLLETVQALFPNTVSHLINGVARLLPTPEATDEADDVHSGRESHPDTLPRILTSLVDKAAVRNNE